MKKLAYFDNAATTFPKPEDVYRFMDTFYRECGVNVGRGQHELAAKAAAMVTETRKMLLELCHCPSRSIVFTPSATEAINVILNSVVIKDNTNIYLSPFEHNAVVRVLHHISQKFDISINTLFFDKTAMEYNLEEIEKQFLQNKPDVVVISHASNVCGIVAPISKICTIAKRHDATTVIDMCQTMGLIDTNLNNENIDYAVFAAHKTLYGSMGLGGFIFRSDAKLHPLLYGGTGFDSANLDLPKSVPERYEVGSANLPAIAGLNASLKWIKKTGIFSIYQKEQINRMQLIKTLTKYGNIKLVLCPNDESSAIGVVSCLFDGYSSDNIGQVLSNHGVAVRTGLHCAPNAHQFMGTFPAGTVRFSVGYFNSGDDFIILENALSFICENA